MAIIDKVVTKDSLRYFLSKLKEKFALKTEITVKSISVNGTPVTADDNKNVNIVTAGTYELPPATTTTLGGIIVGDNLSVTSNGTLSAIVPTNNNQLTNGAGYQTASEVSSAIAAAKLGAFVIVDTLPETGDAGTIYLVPKSPTQTNNGYYEYMYINNAWEKIGDTEIDLSGYLKKTDITEITNEDIDELFTNL